MVGVLARTFAKQAYKCRRAFVWQNGAVVYTYMIHTLCLTCPPPAQYGLDIWGSSFSIPSAHLRQASVVDFQFLVRASCLYSCFFRRTLFTTYFYTVVIFFCVALAMPHLFSSPLFTSLRFAFPMLSGWSLHRPLDDPTPFQARRRTSSNKDFRRLTQPQSTK